MNKKIFFLAILVLPIALVSGCIDNINNFDDCANAGYPVMDSYPRQCSTPEGRVFTEEYCSDGKNVLTLENARNIAIAECGSIKDNYVCNENTGTYWIELDMQKPGCNPACVINLETREAEINWRCTGLIE